MLWCLQIEVQLSHVRSSDSGVVVFQRELESAISVVLPVHPCALERGGGRGGGYGREWIGHILSGHFLELLAAVGHP